MLPFFKVVELLLFDLRQKLTVSSGWPRTGYVAQDGLKHMDPLASTSRVLRLQMCATNIPDQAFREKRMM